MLLSNALIIPLSPITLPVTEPNINFSVVNTKNPAAMAPAIGNPTSPTNFKNSILSPRIVILFIKYQHKYQYEKNVNTYRPTRQWQPSVQ